jgi:hypothetical protein
MKGFALPPPGFCPDLFVLYQLFVLPDKPAVAKKRSGGGLF